MNIYGILASERSSKGQGGNRFLRATFAIGTAKDSKEVLSIVLDNKGIFEIRDKNNNIFKIIQIKNLLLEDITGDIL